MQWARKQTGFTIVELLIVVVVIAILAAITIVSYNGIIQRANASSAQNSASSASERVAAYAIDNSDTYPTSLSNLNISGGNTTFQYSVNNSSAPKGYCITATVGGASYYVANSYTYTGTSTTTLNQMNPTSGACPGHGTTGIAISNLSPNPNVESSITGFSPPPNSSTATSSSARAYQGTYSLLVTMPVSAADLVGARLYDSASLGGANNFQLNSTYTISAYVYVPTGTIDPYITVQGTGKATRTDPAARTTSLKNQWVRISNVFTTAASSGALQIYILNSTATGTAGTQFWVDNIMFSEGSTVPNYADGNSAGWAWSSTINGSPSTGPAL